jgi:hypothetical protein
MEGEGTCRSGGGHGAGGGEGPSRVAGSALLAARGRLRLEPRLPVALGRALPAAHSGALDGAPRPRQMGPAAASAA